MNINYILAHSHTMRLATADDTLVSNTIIFTVNAFKPNSGKYQYSIELAVENVNIEDIHERYTVYNDVIDTIRNRNFYKNSFIVVDSTLFYPTMLFT